MSQKPKLYYALFSPPSRACLITAKLIGLDLELKLVDFAKGEHLSEEFIKLNPQHQVPVFVDSDGEVYCESHAIVCFMLGKYGKSDELYPQDLKRRAHIDHRIHYDNGVLTHALRSIVTGAMNGNEAEITAHSKELCHNSYADLEQFLQKSNFVAGNELSVADVSINATLITMDLLVPVEPQRYPKLCAWLERMKPLIPDYEEMNLKGAQAVQFHVQSCMETNKAKINA